MSLGIGTLRLMPGMPAGWYKVAMAVPFNVGAANTNATIKFDVLQQLQSDARKAGLVPFVHAIGFSVNWNIVSTASGAGVEGWLNQVQRMCAINCFITQPNISGKYMNTAMQLAKLNHLCKNINPVVQAVCLDSHPKRRALNPWNQRHDNVNDTLVRRDDWTGAEQYQAATLGDNDNIEPQFTPTATTLEYSDVVVMPLCHVSASNRFGGPMVTDKLPLSLLCDNTQPWTVQLSTNQGVKVLGASGLFPHGTSGADTTVDVMIFVSFVKMAHKIDYGVHWQTNLSTQAIAGQVMPPHLYSGIYALGVYTSNFVEPVGGGLLVPYEPLDPFVVTSADNSIIRIFDDKEQRFPFEGFSGYNHMFDLLDRGASIGANPVYVTADTAVPHSEVFVGPSSTYALPNIIDNGFSTLYYGVGTPNLYPVLRNLLNAQGFIPGVMSDPSNASNSYIQINLENNINGYRPPNENSPNLALVYVGENAMMDDATIQRYLCNDAQRKLTFKSCVDFPGGLDGVLSPLVPKTAAAAG